MSARSTAHNIVTKRLDALRKAYKEHQCYRLAAEAVVDQDVLLRPLVVTMVAMAIEVKAAQGRRLRLSDDCD